MKIGFDLDGVLVQQSTVEIILMKDNAFAEKLYYETRKPLLNPYLFLNEEDEGVIITSRKESLRKVTERHCRKHHPNLRLFHVTCPQWKSHKDVEEWFKEIARRKSEVINKLQLDIYFEDMPETVEELRKLCPNTKIIQYGGRLR